MAKSPRTRAAGGGRSAARPPSAARGGAGARGSAHWHLRLYVAGQTPKSVAALSNLRRFCDEHLPGQYEVEVIDLIAQPQLAAQDQILAIPTLVRRVPEPLKKIIGDLSQTERVLVGFDLQRERG